MIDSAMLRRLLTQCGMESAVIDEASMRLSIAIFSEGRKEGCEAAAQVCEKAGAAMAWSCAPEIRAIGEAAGG